MRDRNHTGWHGMFEKSLFRGELVRLAPTSAQDQQTVAEWSNNDEYLRLADDDPARPIPPEEQSPARPDMNSFGFSLRTLADDRLIGGCALFNIKWTHRTAGLGLVIGEPSYWGRGYGGDALALLVGYAFRELNLYRVGLDVMSYNTRAVRLYEKFGFVHEGTRRSAIWREGQRYDLLFFGLLREEWLALQS
jgi:RimJ/RimL family protein N-acetyltransferase